MMHRVHSIVARPALLLRAPLRAVHVEARLEQLKLRLPPPNAPKGNYVSATHSGNLVFLSGHLPYDASGKHIAGKVGQDLTVEQGYEAARAVTLSMLSTLKHELGDLDRVVRVLKVTGMVQCDGTFQQHPQVLNGCSDLLVAVLGEAGKHARSAAGFVSLPLNSAVEIELVAEIRREWQQ
eukprot:Unigene6272_Nuclearia_a/m.19315 Unigene6272_Nuclearia_a/g.19315  ORF Unigene6272_Nuclearia_a/g.19315 Unigene6272_Nuclearia_a/m.19315 type:complete len:180 (+) Unigene6272_Nuclearia_a:38-577(+)